MRSFRLAACLLAAALAVGACSGDDDDASPVTVAPDSTTRETSAPTDETTTTTEDPEAAVEAAFFAQWDALVGLSSDPDVADPVIDEYFVDGARDNVVDALSRLIDEGFATRLPDTEENFRVEINEVRLVSEAMAIVYECSVDGLVVYDVATGNVVDADVSPFEKKNTFVLTDGAWKLSKTEDLTPEDPQCG